jgi:hypothetical protein
MRMENKTAVLDSEKLIKVVTDLDTLQLLLMRAQLVLLQQKFSPDSYDDPDPDLHIFLRRFGTNDTSPELSPVTVHMVAESGAFHLQNYASRQLHVTADLATLLQVRTIFADEVNKRTKELSTTHFSSDKKANIPLWQYTISDNRRGKKMSLWCDTLQALLAQYLYENNAVGDMVQFEEIADFLVVTDNLYTYKTYKRKPFSKKTFEEKCEAIRQAAYVLNTAAQERLEINHFLVIYRKAIMRMA